MFKKSVGSGVEPTPKALKRRLFWQKARRRTLIGLSVFFVVHTALNLYASVQLNRELSAIREKGEPIQLSEMQSRTVPDAQNAALVYEQATKSLQLTPEEKIALVVLPPKQSRHQKLVAEVAIRKNQRTLALVRKAASMPLCRFDVKWNQDPLLVAFPYYAKMRDLARLVGAQARLEAENGDTIAALDNVRAIFGISQHLSNEPTYIGFLVAQSMNAIASNTLVKVLETTPLTVVQAHNFQSSLPDTDWAESLRHGMLGERTLSASAYYRLGYSAMSLATEDGPDLSTKAYTYPLLWFASPILKLDQVQSLRLWRQLIDSNELMQIPAGEDFYQSFNSAVNETPRYAVLTRILMPVFSNVAYARDNAEVRRRQREIGLALACYRTNNGQYPANLQLAEKLWGKPFAADVYGNKPFMYRTEKEGFRLYSVGANGVDNEGKGQMGFKPKKPALEDDIAWGGRRE